MKKSFMYLMTMMMVSMVSVGFASCSSDDDEGAPESLVGTVWESVGPDGDPLVLAFESSSKATLKLMYNGKVEKETVFRYTYDPKTGKGTGVDDDGEKTDFVVKGNTLSCKVDGESMTFKRTNLKADSNDDDDDSPNVPAPASLVGTVWEGVGPDGDPLVLSIESSSKATLKLMYKGEVEKETVIRYTYDPKTGKGSGVDDDGETTEFVVKGNTLTFKVDGNTLTFKRTK